MSDLGFLLDDFLKRAVEVRHVIALSSDGILVARDQQLGQELAERLAAATSGLVSLVREVGKGLAAGACSMNLSEYEGGFLLTMAAGQGGSLVAFADPDSDMAKVTYELGALVQRVGDALIPAARAVLSGGPAWAGQR